MRGFVRPVVLMVFLLTIFGLAPAVLAAKPTRTLVEFSDPWVFPAGLGCAFDVGAVPSDGARGAITDFGDGVTATVGHGNGTFTNLDTGASYFQMSRYRAIETYDPVTNDVVIQLSGRVWFNLYPGDQGPFGLVDEPGALLSIQGQVAYTFDLDTELVTSFSLDGQATDICALLS